MIRIRRSLVRMFLFVLLAGIAIVQAPMGLAEDSQVSILRTNNKAQTTKYVAKVYEFKNNNPYNVRRFLQRPLTVEEGSLFTYVNPDYKSGMVLMICPEHQLPYYDKLMPYLDQPGQGTADGSIRDFIKFKHRSVADSDFIAALSTQMSTDSWLYTDSELNGIYISDAPSGYAGVNVFLDAEGGAPRDQVDVTVTIYEIALNNDQKVGLDYMAWKNGPGQALFSAGIFSEYEHASNLEFEFNGVDSGNTPLFNTGSNVAGLPGQRFDAYGYNATYFLDVPSQYFDYLAVRGKAKVLTKSRLSVLDGDSALVHTGDKLLYYDVAADSESRTVTAQLLETGIILELTPVIGTETINFEICYDAVTLKGFDGSGMPLTAASSYYGKMRVPEGREVVLGGLNSTADASNSSKVPILGSIPVLGYLFGGESDLNKQSMVAVVLQPEVIKNAGSNLDSDANLLISEVTN